MMSPNFRTIVGLCAALGGAAIVSGASSSQPASVPNWSAPASWTAPAHRGSHALAIESDIGGPLPFVPVTPCRIVDTRNAAGPYGGPSIAPGSPRSFALAGGPCTGIPSTVAAYSLNITATNTTGTGFVKVYPQGGVSPVVSTLNFVAGETVANAAVVPAGTGGGITVAAAARTDVLIDINGYYVSTLNGNEQLLVTANAAVGAIRGVNGSGDGVQGQTSNAGSSGVFGTNTANGKGVFGTSGGGSGVEGQSTSGSGLRGNSSTGSGVEGQSTSGPGLRGDSSTGSGVYGRTAGSSGKSGAAGVWGDTHDFFGVWGSSVTADGVHGDTNSSASGVAGFNAGSGVGVYGSSFAGWGSYGHSQLVDGVHGDTPSNSSAGVAGINTGQGFGVFGSTNGEGSGAGVFGQAITTNGNPDDNGAGVHAFGTSNCGDVGEQFIAPCTDGTYAFISEGPATFTGGVLVGSGGLRVNTDLYVVGDKSFVTPHPTDPSKQIAFVCLEGPEAGTYFRGTGHFVGGFAEVPVPESFRLVTSTKGLTAVATATGAPASIYCVSKSLDKIIFQSSADVDFDYVVNGVRAGFENNKIIQDNTFFVPRKASDKLLSRLPAEAVRRLKANGILNEDGTINEATAHRLGWDQRSGWGRAAASQR